MARMAYKFTWRQASVELRVDQATMAGIEDTMDACVAQAKRNAPVLTGRLRDDISRGDAQRSGTRITGRWGNWTVPYAIFQEEGTINNRATHYLQRAADQEYPMTNARIRSHL